jgi:hypothetical protein
MRASALSKRALYAGLMEVWTNGEGKGLGLHAKTAGEMTAALLASCVGK